MPGSCDSDQGSSSTRSNSLRTFRLLRKKTNNPAGSPAPRITAPAATPVTTNAPTTINRTPTINRNPTRNFVTAPPSNSPLQPQQKSPSVYNPLSYRKYGNSSDSQTILQNISAKIQALFKSNTEQQPVLDLKLTIAENDQLKEIILQHYTLSLKWSSNVSEITNLNPSEKVYKIKKPYLWELSRKICTAVNGKLLTASGAQVLDQSSVIRTYSRTKTPAHSIQNQNSVKNSVHSADNSTPGTMDDYEEFCEKEQSLRKLLDAFPGADIMEAQDILVKCQWDLTRALQEANSLPLRTAKKRGPTGSFITHSSVPASLPNNSDMADSMQIPEEIVLDSSDEDDINGNATGNNRSHSGQPPVKRARRPISTSSEDESVVQKKCPAPPQNQKPQLQQQAPVSSVPQNSVAGLPKPNVVSEPKPNPVARSNSSPVDPPSTTVPAQSRSAPVPKAAQISSEAQPSISDNSSEKTINIPKGLSLKPVPAAKTVPVAVTTKPTPTVSINSEPSPSAPLPNLPKWLVVTQVGNDNPSKSAKEALVNGNNGDSGASSSNKSAQLVRLKASTSLTATPVSNPSPVLPSGLSVSCTPVSKNVSVTPVGKSVSLTPVSASVNLDVSAQKRLSITPVVGDNEELSQGKSAYSSSTEEEPDADEKPSKRGRIKNKHSLIDSDDNKEKSDEMREKKKKGKGKGGKGAGRRKKFDSDDDDDVEYGNEDIYDSEDSDCGENLTPAHSAVLKFFQDATPEELGSVPGCSKKKVDALLKLRPFSKWADLVEKLKNDKVLSTDLLNGAKKVLDMRNAINKLMAKCQRISLDMEDLVENLKENKESSTGYVGKQPELLNERMHLTGYQMLGLNWLLLMHNQEVNGILADEMGLGKTVQAISFLAYLKQIKELGPHLIVVPSSTMDNWKKEFETWWPSVSLICYHGQQDSRRELRMQILNDEVDEFDVMITTYNMVTSSAEDRGFFKRIEFNYVVFDEAHMLKNMSSQRYNNLMRIKAPRRLLLTGTPLQNNLVELMSLLIFAMPHMFSGKTEQIKQMFTCVSKSDSGIKNTYEKDRIEHAKRIMRPFVLRRLKKDVLKELPAKTDETKYCPMLEDQADKYKGLVEKFSAEVQESKDGIQTGSSGAGMMMQLRRAANHPLLLRRIYDDEKLKTMSKKIVKEPTHTMSDPNLVFEDMSFMSDFELHNLCKQYKSLKPFALPDDAILNSGKFKVLDDLLTDLIKEDHRILLFSQFTMVLDIIQEYMKIKKYKFLRLDGQVPVQERQQLIDEFNTDPEILVFLLSTRAGGLGINLTAADTVVLHDIDFNPYNDKQAEDRCHRVGQVRDVRVIRLISENTIEEGILQRAKEKLKLEKDIHEDETEENDTASVVMLLRNALGIKPNMKS